MRYRFPSILALLLVATSQPLEARVVPDLYFAQAIVTGTEEPERTRGFREALETVFVKLAGNTKLATDPRIASLTAKPHAFVETFAYEDRMKDIPVHDEQGTRERPHFLRVTFSRPAIDVALQQLGIPQWPADRPVVAVWLAIDMPAGQFVLTDSGPTGYGQRAVITETAQRLGLPIRLPAGSDSAITFDDIARERIDAMRNAAPDADAHVLGRLLARTDGYWDLLWTFHARDGVRHWKFPGVTFDTGLKQGFASTVETLSGAARK